MLKVNLKCVVDKYLLDSINIPKYYNDSIKALVIYINNSEKNPNESLWNHYAIEHGLLSAESLGYIYEIGFNKLCKKIRKDLNNIG